MRNVVIEPAGDAAALIVLGDTIDLAVNRAAHVYAAAIQRSGLNGVGECLPGYASVLVHYDPLAWDFADLAARLRSLLAGGWTDLQAQWQPRVVVAPVVYGGAYGPDLGFVARRAGLSEAEVIRLHSQAEYPVMMMGFTPGFPYLSGMDERLASPRLDSPRERVPAGSVGIAGKQTGIYSIDSPGGWRIIGRTPLRLFDPQREPPFLFAPGDVVRFAPIAEMPERAEDRDGVLGR